MISVAPKVVALGGGHGLDATLRALTKLGASTTAVVTVADDGGSSGRLRKEFGVLPPGDLRMALAALCADDPSGSKNAEIFQYRFSGDGPLSGHPIGNLVLTALWDLERGHVAALARAGALLGAQGVVLPMANEPLEIIANVELNDGSLQRITGQVNVANAPGRIVDVSLVPPDPGVYAQTLEAITTADWIVLGPGSWFTSILPALMIPALRDAILASKARKMVVLNLVDQPGETEGLGPVEHLGVLGQYAQNLRVDVVVVDTSHEAHSQQVRQAATDLGAQVVFAEVGANEGVGVHDPARLSRVLNGIFTRVP